MRCLDFRNKLLDGITLFDADINCPTEVDVYVM